MRQVHRAVLRVGPLALRVKNVKVVAADSAHHFGPHLVNLGGVGGAQITHLLANLPRAPVGRFEATHIDQRAVCQPGLRAQHVMHHVAVSD